MSSVLLTPEGDEILKWADRSARLRHQSLVDSEHLLDGALQHQFARKALEASGLSADAILDKLLLELGMVRDDPLEETLGLTKDATLRLQHSETIAKELGQNTVNSAHIALAMLDKPSPVIQEILDSMSALDLDAMKQYIRNYSPKTDGVRKNITNLQSERVRKEKKKLDRQQIRERQKNAPKIVITSGRGRQASQGDIIQGMPNWALYVIGAVAVLTIVGITVDPLVTAIVWMVVAGWIFSVAVHEFAHALVAYWGGDYTVREKGYLTFNPLKYTHPLTTFGLPLLFFAIGGLGLPGGAVYINRQLLRNKHWSSAVSAAGPFGSLVCLIGFSLPFWTGMITRADYWAGYTSPVEYTTEFAFYSGLAFLSFLQVTAILFNLIPFPPLDGFGIIEPYLPPDIAGQLRQFGFAGLFLIFFLFTLPAFSGPFFDVILSITDWLGIFRNFIADGFDIVLFWR